MTVDTGAFHSALSRGVALDLGVPVEALPLEPEWGSTGPGLLPLLQGFYWSPLVPGFHPILVKGASILPKEPAPLSEEPRWPTFKHILRDDINLLGMDILESLGARLYVDMAAGRGRVEWP